MNEKHIHRTIKAFVTDSLREEIISGDYEGGQHLRQELLASKYDCSLIPVREALLTLQGEGLVTFTPRKGAVVNVVNEREIDEIFTARAYLECDLLERAIPMIDNKVIERAEQALNEFEELLKPNSNVEDWGYLNNKFHTTLYEPANRPFTMEMIQRLLKGCDRYIRLEIQLDENREETHNDHIEILKHVRNRDKSKAKKALRQDIMSTSKNLIQKLTHDKIN